MSKFITMLSVLTRDSNFSGSMTELHSEKQKKNKILLQKIVFSLKIQKSGEVVKQGGLGEKSIHLFATTLV